MVTVADVIKVHPALLESMQSVCIAGCHRLQVSVVTVADVIKVHCTLPQTLNLDSPVMP